MLVNAARFTEIVARERSRLGNFIRGQVRDAADGEDTQQDVLLEFYAATNAIEQADAGLFRGQKPHRRPQAQEEGRAAAGRW